MRRAHAQRLTRRILLTTVVLLPVVALAAAPVAAAPPKPRPVLILPYQALAAADDGWFGEGIAETLFVAAQATPALLPIDRSRVAVAARAGGDALAGPVDKAALPLGRALKADWVLYGDYQRGPDGVLTITPRFIEVKTGETQALEPITSKPGRIVEIPGELVVAYVKALKLGLKADEVQRMQAAAKPTTNPTAFEAFAKGRRAALANTQEGNEGAAELLARAVEIDPTFALAHYHLGMVHLILGNRWKAAAQFRAATQVDPTLADPYKSLGDLFMSSPRRLYDQAIEAYEKAVALRPHYAEAQVGLGDARGAKGDNEGAIAHYQKALALDPLNARVHFALGKIYYSEKGLYYEAVTAYKKAVDLDPYFLDARMGLGEIYEEKGLYKDAIAEYRKVIETDPKHTGARYNLALAYEKIDPREAIAQWEKYIDLAAQVATEKEWVDVARQHLKKLREKHPQ